MLNQPASTTRQLGRYLLAAPLLMALALGYSSAHAQVAPAAAKPLPTDAHYYIDGQLSDKTAVEKLDTSAIASVQMLTGLQARSFAHAEVPGGIIVVTTKPQQQNSAVRTINSQLNKLAGPVVPVSVSELPPAALAYITSHYPGYRLVSVGKINPAGKQPLQYQATIALGRRPEYLLFDGQGQKATP